ncbi:hypothetical protein D3C76_1860000 [compost metagenome]
MEVLPFQAITYLPGSVFTGRVEGTGIWSVLGIQVFWFVILLVPMMLIWRQARKRLFVQGG